ncbi:MAG: carbon-nitrogen hydrolase family protein, partial [bacterium]
DRDVVISVYQGPCRDGDLTFNLATARKAIELALQRGSHFLALPEAFLSGCDTFDHLKQGARSIEDSELTSFIEESSAHDMVIIVGFTRVEEEGMYNSAMIIQQGELLGMYDKVMLTGGDRAYGILPGLAVPVFEAHGVRFAVNICHDTSFPHPALMARLQGAEILFTPHYNHIAAQKMDDHRKWVRNCHIGLACQLKMVVARSNVVATHLGDRLGYGQSLIVSPQGEMLAEAELFRTELVTARVTPAMLRSPYVWANLDDVPVWLKIALAGLLTK